MKRCKPRYYTKILYESFTRTKTIYLYDPTRISNSAFPASLMSSRKAFEQMVFSSNDPYDHLLIGPLVVSEFNAYNFEKMVHLAISGVSRREPQELCALVDWLMNAHKRP